MKLIVQIPRYNEKDTLPTMLADIHREIDGAEERQNPLIDKGSGGEPIQSLVIGTTWLMQGFVTRMMVA